MFHVGASFFFKSRPPYQVEKKKEVGVPEEGVSCKTSDVKFKDPKFKHEIFERIDMKHSYLNYFIICLPSYFSVIEIIIELFLPKHNSCVCYI